MPKILHLDIFLMNMKYKKEHPCLQTLAVEQTWHNHFAIFFRQSGRSSSICRLLGL